MFRRYLYHVYLNSSVRLVTSSRRKAVKEANRLISLGYEYVRVERS